MDFQSMLPNLSELTKINATPGPIAFSYADTQFEIIKKYVEDFQRTLDEDHEVGLLLTNFGQSMLMNVTDIGFEESVLMIFRGYVDRQKATLIQHISQISFLLTSVPKIDPNAPPRRIGFNAHWEE